MAQRGIDMTGWIMSEHGVPDSRWKVISLADEKINGQLAWNCECSCSNHTKKIIAGGELRRGKTKSCGCYRKELMSKTKSKNLIGKVFGELTVLEDSGKRASDGTIIYRCSCSCGNLDFLISTSELTRTEERARIHCNNSIHTINNLTGQTFGDLEVIEIDKTSIGSGKIKWYCKCHNCNRKDLVSILGNSLLMGQSNSCGCGHSLSRGAAKTQSILQEAKLDIIQEYSFNNLINPNTKQKLRFDFAIFNNNKLKYLIEYDGEQHFKYQSNSGKSWNTESHYKETIYKDNLKNEYCIKNNISLYRIPYTDIKDINKLQDILQEKYLINNK